MDRVTSFKYLGVVLNQSLTWADHIEALSNKIAQRIGLIKRIKHLLPVHARITLANCLVVPLFDYADFVWEDKDSLVLMNQLQIMHNKLAKVILDWQPRSFATEALRTLNWHPLVVRRQLHPDWNMLPTDLRNATDLRTFKLKLKKTLLSDPEF